MITIRIRRQDSKTITVIVVISNQSRNSQPEKVVWLSGMTCTDESFAQRGGGLATAARLKPRPREAELYGNGAMVHKALRGLVSAVYAYGYTCIYIYIERDMYSMYMYLHKRTSVYMCMYIFIDMCMLRGTLSTSMEASSILK